MRPIELVNWELDYSVDVVELDSQHRELMNLVNDMINHSTDNETERKKYFQRIIFVASSHVAKHFDTEEKVLSRTNYGIFEEHKKEHKKITEKIKAIQDELGNNNGDIALQNLTVTLKEYFLSHILLYDKEAKEFFKAGSKIIASADFQAGIV